MRPVLISGPVTTAAAKSKQGCVWYKWDSIDRSFETRGPRFFVYQQGHWEQYRDVDSFKVREGRERRVSPLDEGHL